MMTLASTVDSFFQGQLESPSLGDHGMNMTQALARYHNQPAQRDRPYSPEQAEALEADILEQQSLIRTLARQWPSARKPYIHSLKRDSDAKYHNISLGQRRPQTPKQPATV